MALTKAQGKFSKAIDDGADATAITIDSSEQVGIGLETPLYKLQVAGASSDADGALGSQSPLFSIQGGNANNQLEFGMDNSGATAIGFIQSRNLSAGAQTISLNPKGGNVGIGTTSPSDKLHVYGGDSGGASAHSYTQLHVEHGSHAAIQISTPTNAEAALWFADADDAAAGGVAYTHNSNALYFRVNGAERVRFDADGYIVNTKAYNATTSSSANLHVLSNGYILRSSSSRKYKTDIEDAWLSLAENLYSLRPVYYKSLGEFDNRDWSHWGFIAEEVAEVDPRLVHYKEIEVSFNEEGERIETKLDAPEPDGVQYDRMVPLLLKLVQEQKQRIEALETKTEDLQTRLSALEAN